MSKPVEKVPRKNSLRQHEKETLRGASLRSEPILIYVILDSAVINN